MLEFLASLKYYTEIWQRAKCYAQFAGFVKTDTASQEAFPEVANEQVVARVKDGSFEDLEIPVYDIFL